MRVDVGLRLGLFRLACALSRASCCRIATLIDTLGWSKKTHLLYLAVGEMTIVVFPRIGITLRRLDGVQTREDQAHNKPVGF